MSIATINGIHRTIWLLVHGAVVVPAWAYNGPKNAARVDELAGATPEEAAVGIVTDGDYEGFFVDS